MQSALDPLIPNRDVEQSHTAAEFASTLRPVDVLEATHAES